MKCFFSSATRIPSAEDGPRFHRVSMTRCSRLLRFFFPPNIVALQNVVDSSRDVKTKKEDVLCCTIMMFPHEFAEAHAGRPLPPVDVASLHWVRMRSPHLRDRLVPDPAAGRRRIGDFTGGSAWHVH